MFYPRPAADGKFFLIATGPMIDLSAMQQTLFLRDFTVLDFAFLEGHQGNVLGESLFVSVELEGTLDGAGFILDFGPAKKILKSLVDSTLDHSLVVPALLPGLVGTPTGFRCGTLSYGAPSQAVVMLETDQVIPATLENFLEERAKLLLPQNVKSVRFILSPDTRFNREPNFRYTHGLRLHEGNCQRLLHGHRNPIEVWMDGTRYGKAEEFLAGEWENAHFTHVETLTNRNKLDIPIGQRRKNLTGIAEIAYEAPQGLFSVSMPSSKIILLESEPSIENIARLGAQRLRQEGITGGKVVAYEGLNKGASFQF